MTAITLIHPFQVSQENEKKFLQAWAKVDQYMQKQNGFIETRLHRSLNIANLTTFSFVNIALWESVASFGDAVKNDEFSNLAKEVLIYSCGPALYSGMD